MSGRKIQFSMATMLGIVAAAAALFGFCFTVPVGQFVFEGGIISVPRAPLTIGHVTQRLLIVGPLVALEVAGVAFVVRQYRKIRLEAASGKSSHK